MRLAFGATLLTLFVTMQSQLFSLPQPVPEGSEAIALTPYSEPIPILVYHHVRPTKGYDTSTWSYKMSVSPEVFKHHSDWIRDRGYTTITLDQFVSMRRGETQAPEKPVVITFDDNQRSQYEVAFPMLRENGQTAVFYLVTNRLRNPAFIVEEEVKEMAAAGMDIQSHTHSHSMLTNLSLERITEELVTSRQSLEALLGTPVRHVAYPLTAHSQRVRDATKAAGYDSGTIMDPRDSLLGDDVFKLPRIMMTDDTDVMKILP